MQSDASSSGAFAGAWQDDEGTVVVVKGSRMYGPDGGQLDLNITSRTSCSFQMGTVCYEGRLTSDGRLEWNDGAIWVRAADQGDNAVPRTAEEQAARTAQANGHGVTNGNGYVNGNHQDHARQSAAKEASDAGIDRARKAFEEEKARKAAALERARAARAAAEQQSPVDEAAKEASDSGIDRARKAFEEEKARKAAALERARAARAAAEQKLVMLASTGREKPSRRRRPARLQRSRGREQRSRQ
eukprot:TRINITY_DN6451_c0_g1_i4.p1 TRINITY_DN6451_c0_g1~~TRINITY_DN6451_c0_g1_i4.p1  ORF type:complete len:257 (-),score=71.86 TRINITY_DN6451_c0_g1_i4:34-765(-)